MKRILLIASSLLLLLSLTSRAGIQTVISGKVLNKTEKPLVLLVYSFDTTLMQEVEELYRMKIREDNSFSFVTDKITSPYTFCRIGFDNEGMKMRVSPGDSLFMQFSSGAMDSTIVFSGSNAGINQYLTQYELDFGNPYVNMELFREDSSGEAWVSFLTEIRDKKQTLLKTGDSVWHLSPDFLALETLRLECDYYNSLMYSDIWALCGDSVRLELEQSMRILVSMSDGQSLLVLREYRDFITRYINFYLDLPSGRTLRFHDYIDEAGKRLSGLDHTYYCFSMIKGKIQQTRSRNDKILIRDHFVKHNPDLKLVSLLKTMKIPGFSIRSMASVRDLISGFYWLLLVVLAGVVLIIGFFVFKALFKNQFVWNYFAFIQVMGFLAALSGLIVYAIWDYHPANPWTTIMRALAMIGLASLALLYVIPAAHSKDKMGTILWKSITASIIFAAIMIGISISEPTGVYNYQEHSGFTALLIITSLMFIWFWSFSMFQIKSLLSNLQVIRNNWSGRIDGFEPIIVLALVIALVSRSFYLYLRHQTGASEILVLLTCLALFLVHALWLVPKYFREKKITNYLIGAVAALIGVTLLLYLERSVENYHRISNLGLRVHFADVWQLSGGNLIKTTLAIQLLLIPGWLYAWVRVQLKQRYVGFKMFRNKEAEFQQLRSQVNPHFLFNSLNTVYAFALKENNPKTAEYIAKLASLMRYLIEDMEKEKIPVEREIEYIRDYMNLQKIRSGVEHSIEFTVEDNFPGFQIAPMLMIPFVENAFKHGMNPNKKSELKIHIQVQEHQFLFDIENSADPDFTAFYKEKGFGIGIENVRQRLEFLYPGKHTIFINKQENSFRVTLTLLY